MSKRSQEKRKARSKEKKLAQRRLQSTSPLSRLAGTAAETAECWAHFDPQDERIQNLMVIRPVRGGGHVAGYFLIDLDCLGLKDAIWRSEANPAELRESMRQRSRDDGTRFVKLTLAELRSQVAAAVRWTTAHPFRLPPDTGSAIKLLGDPLDVEHADVSNFGTEDGLFYVGWEEDLTRALKEISLDEFLDRPDVECDFYDDDDDALDEEYADGDENPFDADEPLTEEDRRTFALADAMVAELLAQVNQWGRENGQTPSPQLDRAAHMKVAFILTGVAAVEAGENDEQAEAESVRAMEEMIEQVEDESIPGVIRAFEQMNETGAADPERLIHAALDRIKSHPADIVDVPLQHTLPMERPCSTPVTQNSPPSSSSTPAASNPASTC